MQVLSNLGSAAEPRSSHSATIRILSQPLVEAWFAFARTSIRRNSDGSVGSRDSDGKVDVERA